MLSMKDIMWNSDDDTGHRNGGFTPSKIATQDQVYFSYSSKICLKDKIHWNKTVILN